MQKLPQSILIPYTTQSVDEVLQFNEHESLIHTVYCSNDDAQIFIKTTRKHERNESELLLCPFCKKPLERGNGLSNYVSSSTTPEVIACLSLNEKLKSLQLVLQKSYSKPEMVAVTAILDRHNFTKFASKINVFQLSKNFQQTLKPLKKKDFILSKFLQKISSRKLKQPEKLNLSAKKLPDEPGVIINRADYRKKWILKHTLEQIKKRWIVSQNVTPIFQLKSKNAARKKLYLMRNTPSAMNISKKLLLTSTSASMAFFQLQLLTPILRADPYLSEKMESPFEIGTKIKLS